jgi:hypothetical protein
MRRTGRASTAAGGSHRRLHGLGRQQLDAGSNECLAHLPPCPPRSQRVRRPCRSTRPRSRNVTPRPGGPGDPRAVRGTRADARGHSYGRCRPARPRRRAGGRVGRVSPRRDDDRRRSSSPGIHWVACRRARRARGLTFPGRPRMPGAARLSDSRATRDRRRPRPREQGARPAGEPCAARPDERRLVASTGSGRARVAAPCARRARAGPCEQPGRAEVHAGGEVARLDTPAPPRRPHDRPAALEYLEPNRSESASGPSPKV